jgi:hypothetical protein
MENVSADESPIPATLSYAPVLPPQNVVVWCRLLAIGLLAMGIERVITAGVFLIMDFTGGMGRIASLPYALEMVSMALVWPVMAWICWSRAPQLAIKITRGTHAETSTDAAKIRVNEILSVSLLVLGLYEVGEAIPLLKIIFGLTFASIVNLSYLPWKEFAGPLARLGFGTFLIFRNHWTVARLRSV